MIGSIEPIVKDFMKNINERARLLIETETNESRRFKQLEEITNIPSATWKTFWNRGNNPSSLMIEQICKHWPEYTLWLMTATDDVIGGQISPSTPTERRQAATTKYLKRRTELINLKIACLIEGGGNDLSEWEVDELNALWNVRVKELTREIQRRLTNTDNDEIWRNHLDVAEKIAEHDQLNGPIRDSKE